jgi:anti-anti-sigma regulatory factor
VCWTYACDDEHRHALHAYFSDGIAAGEKLLFFGPAEAAAGLVAELGPLPDGQLVVESGVGAATGVGEARVRRVVAAAAQAQEEGYTGLRVAGSTEPGVTEAATPAQLAAVELRLDLLAARLPVVALCGYDVRTCDPTALSSVEAVHPLIHLSGTDGGSSFHIHGTDDGGIAVAGEIDATQSDLVETLLRGSMDELADPVIDVSELGFADIAAMRAVAHATEGFRAVQRTVEVRGASPTFRKVWSLLGYGELAQVGAG